MKSLKFCKYATYYTLEEETFAGRNFCGSFCGSAQPQNFYMSLKALVLLFLNLLAVFVFYHNEYHDAALNYQQCDQKFS